MNKIDITYNKFNYSFILDKYKVIYGENFRDKFNIIKCFKHYLSKNNYSDYSNEYLNRTNIKIDEHLIDVKNTFFYEISYNFDLSNDQKLTTKSLTLKYLELYLDMIEYNDEFTTIKTLLEDFISLTLKDLIDIKIDSSIDFELQLSDFNYKSIIKLVEPLILKDSLEINNYDLTYEETIILQLKILEKISLKLDKKIIILADIPLLTSNIISTLNNLSNAHTIIFSNTYNELINIENYLLTDFNMLDLMNEEQIQEFIMELPWHTTSEQLKTKLIESLKKFNLKHLFFNKII